MFGPSRFPIRLPFIALLCSFAFATASPAAPPAKEGELIIKFREGTPQSVIDAIKQDLGATRLRAFGRIRAEHDRITAGTVDEAIGRYRNHPAVEFIEPNYIVSEVVVPDDPFFPNLWGLRNVGQTGGVPGADIHAPAAWDISTGSASVIVAIIDTGVDYNHADLAANMYVNAGEIAGNGIDDDGNGFIDDVRGWDFVNHDNDPIDDRGHGTHVAGTIGAVGNNAVGVAGIAWSVRIMPLKFLSAGGTGTTADAVAAVEYATMMGAHVMNNSWGGGGFSLALLEAIQDANAAGIHFVAAAGNASVNTDVTPFYPAAYDVPNVISVAASDASDRLAAFSNFGATTVDLAAPGVDILSTLPGSTYGLNSGTSMAAPHVSGILALLESRFPLAPALALKARLLDTVDPVPDLSSVVASGGRANAFLALADPDGIPPDAVTDVEVVESTSNTLRIRWTATGDDGADGRAAAYEVRYATSPLTEATFPVAALAGGAPSPQPSGSIEEMEVGGLAVNTTYYLALRALDEMGNPSPISNVASGTTLGAPVLALEPASVEEALLTGASTHRAVQVRNVGEGTLDFTLTENLILGSSTVQEFVPVARGETDLRVGDPVAAGFGGPDAFGYRWADSDQPGGPVFDWVEISAVGTQIPMSALDDNQGPIPLGFPFPFYGATFTSLRVCTHGWASFTNETVQYSNQPLPNPGAPENLLAVFWEDLSFGGVRRAYYHNDGTRFILEYLAVPRTDGGGPYTFQVILYPSGRIVYQYLVMNTPVNNATIGIQNATRDDGLTVAFNTDYLHSGMAVEFYRAPQWFHATPASGRVAAGGALPLDVAIDATDLAGGVYRGEVRLTTNDPAVPEAVLPLTLDVTGVADIDLSRTSLDFGALFVGAARTDSLVITNRGTDPLVVSEIAATPADFEASPSSVSLPTGAQQTVVVTFRPSDAVPIAGTLLVRSDDPDEPELSVALSGEGLVAPDIAVAPSSLAADLLTGQSESQSLSVGNEGGSDLVFSARVTNVALPAGFPAETPPSRSAAEIQAGYDAHAADPGAPGPAPPPPAPQPGIVPLGERIEAALDDSLVLFHDDMESGANGWTHAPTTGVVDLWAQTTARASSGITAWRAAQHNGSGSDALRSPSIDLTSARDAMLAFRHWYQFDDCGGDPSFEPDGGVVEVSVDGGVSWIPIAPIGGYPYVLDDICGNPLAYRPAYSHDGGIGNAFVPALFDLTPFIGGTVVLRFHAGWDCGNCGTNEGWYIDDVTVYSSLPPLLTLTPTSGTVEPGSAAVLDARFDAEGLFGGDYTMDVVVESNDPDENPVIVPASLHVTGVADIAWSPESLDFGEVYVGVSATDTLQVVNAGTNPLHVASVSADHPSLSVPVDGFDLAPGGSRLLPVVFTPDAAGPLVAAIRLISDDPDEPVATVPVSGLGVPAPDVVVTPTSVAVALFTDETADRDLTIANEGGSDLVFEVQIDKAAPPIGTGYVPSPSPQSEGTSEESRDDTPVPTAAGAEGALPVVLVIQDTNAWGLSMASFLQTQFGIAPSVIGSAQIPATDFSDYDLVVTVGDEGAAYYTALNANVAKFESYVASGGVVQYQCATRGSNVTLPAGAQVVYGSHEIQNRVVLPGHPIVAGLPATLLGNAANHGHLTSLPAGARVITETFATRLPTTVEYTVGAGTVVATGMTWEFLYIYGYEAGRMLYQATEYSFSLGRPRWITVSPAEGIVPPGQSLDLRVAFDAAGLLAGAYAADLDVRSNDPDTPSVIVPATMDVTGIPQIVVEPASLEFDSLFVGSSTSRAFAVRNAGTDVLTVTAIVSDEAAFSATPGAFTVAIGDTQLVTAAFAPASAGAFAGTLSITHNAPGSPTAVALFGVALDPPDIEIDPTSLAADVTTGEVAHRTLHVLNTGASDLHVSISVEEDPVVAGSEPPVAVPPELTVATANETSPSTEPPATQAVYQGTHLRFGITAYGELMPYQFPIGVEHLQVGAFISGYTVAYLRAGVDHVLYAAEEERFGVTPVSYTEIENSATRIVVEVVTRSTDDLVRIHRRFTFVRDEQFVRVETTVESVSETIENVVYKEVADWDADGDFADDSWNYDPQHHMVYAWDQRYVAVGSDRVPDLMDIYGWNDYTRRETTVDVPAGPVANYDGLEVLHFELGALGVAQTERIVTAYGAANDLVALQDVISRGVGVGRWLAVAPAALSVPPGGAVALDVAFDPGLLPTGDYTARIVHRTNDPDEPEVAVPVSMHVTGAPVIDVAPLALDYDTLFVGESAVAAITIANEGTDDLVVTDFSFDDPSYHAGISTLTLPPRATALVEITFAPTTAGDKGAALSIVHNAAGSPTGVALQGVALVPPVLTLTPPSIHADVETGETEHRTLSVGNAGGSDLRFELRHVLGAAAVTVDSIAPLGKGQTDPRVGDVVAVGQGGPDGFGHRWIDSDQPGGPVFQWVDIRAAGTAIPISGDDATSAPIPIGFDFPFYGAAFNTVRVCTNGWLSFTSATAQFFNTPLPSIGAPANLLAAFWDDLYFNPSSRAYYRYDGTRFIVQFDQVWNLGVGGPYTFEVILYPSGTILYQYLSMTPPVNGATVGIQNGPRNDGLTVAFNQSYIHDALAVRFSSAPDWLVASPLGGVVPAGAALPIDLALKGTGLDPGDYATTIDVSSNDPAAPNAAVPVSIHVIGIPDLVVAPTSLDFDTLYTGQSASAALVMTNAGTDRLDVTSMTPGLPDFTVSPATLSLQPLQSATVTVTYDASTLGLRATDLVLTSNDPDSPALVPLRAVALVPPVIAVSPDTVEAAARPGGGAARTITVCNSGGSDLRFRFASPAPLAVPAGSFLPLAKEEPDPRVAALGSGGPDAFGHFWVDSDVIGGPAFEWNDISSVGTRISFASYDDDRTLGPFPIGFVFPFYGQMFQEFRVCTNGWVSFTSTSNAYGNQPLPNAGPGVPENLLAVFWDDLTHRTDLGSAVHYYSDGAELVIQFTNMVPFEPLGPPLPTFQIVLKPSGEVIYQYLKVGTLSTGVTVGMQNGARDDGLGVSFNAPYPHDNLAIRFVEAVPWLSVAPASGVVPPGGCMPIAVAMDASELDPGDYKAAYRVSSNDPVRTNVAGAAVLHVNEVEAVAADFDPNTLNLDSNGRFTNAWVELPPAFDPSQVVLATVRFGDTIPASQNALLVEDFNGNGVPDLHFRFDREAVEAILPEGDRVPIWIRGDLGDIATFVARDSIRVIRPRVTAPNGGELLLGGAPYVVQWSNPMGWIPDEAALYYSVDHGDSWALIAEHVTGESWSWDVPNLLAPAVMLRVYLLDERGVMGYDSSDDIFAIVNSITGVEAADAALPATEALYQNVPNPFNPVTTIRFDLPRAATVRLEIFGADGRRVRSLVRAPLSAGRHRAVWDGADDRGRPVASGVYHYRVRAGAFQASKRMILLK